MLRTLVVISVVAMAVAGGLYVALPANLAAVDGPADPIRCLRRPVMRVLRKLGLADDDRWFSAAEWGHKETDGTFVREAWMELRREPVYRGLFWRVGDRTTYRLFDDEATTRRALRLCYVEGGVKFVAGEATVDNGLLCRGVRYQDEVTGFVPCSASGYWAEEVDENGREHGLQGWGDTDRFWPD